MGYISQRKPDVQGFTLIEVLVATSILTFGLLAVTTMQVAAIRGNYTAARVTEATSVGQEKIEALIGLPSTHADLQDVTGDSMGGLDVPTLGTVLAGGASLISADGNPGSPDHAQTIAIGSEGYWGVHR